MVQLFHREKQRQKNSACPRTPPSKPFTGSSEYFFLAHYGRYGQGGIFVKQMTHMLMFMSCSLIALLPKHLAAMQEALLEDHAAGPSTQTTPSTKKYTLAEIAIAISYTSDRQEGHAEQGAKQEGFDEMTPALFNRWPHIQAKTEVRAGDLIDGKENQGALRAFLGATIAQAFSCGASGSVPAEQTRLATQKIEEFEQKTGIAVQAGPGNHDFYDSRYTMLNWIIQRHGNLRYVAKLTNQDGSECPLRIICCGVYADHKTCQWLKTQFETIKKEAGRELPVIVVTHYDEQRGNNKNWLSDAEIQEFADTLDTYNNIQEVATGHSHSSYILHWQPHGPEGKTYFTNCAGGDKKLVSLYDAQGNRLDTLFFKAQKTAAGTYEPVEVEPVIATPDNTSAWDDGIQRCWNHKVIDQWFNEKSGCCK